MTCPHTHTESLGIRCFMGPVAREQNPAAHGGVCEGEECLSCGARRSANVNGSHVERAPWGLSREQRRCEAVRLETEAARLVAAIPALRAGNLAVQVDGEGCLVMVGGDQREHRRLAATLPPNWLAAARRGRRAVQAAQAAREAI